MSRPHTPFPKHLHPSACGSDLRKKKRGRGRRTISIRYSMHLILRSTRAIGVWALNYGGNRALVEQVIAKHASAAEIEIFELGISYNHFHLRLKCPSREQYYHFIRAVAGEIALKIKRIANGAANKIKQNFWSERPLSSIAANPNYLLNLINYIKMNDIEGYGFSRDFARFVLQKRREGVWPEFKGQILII
jgi:REP element-mobilizing transposase RayT